VLIAQITDLHVTEPGALIEAVVDANAMLRAAVDYLNQLDPRPEAVVATGDLADRGRPEEYAILRELLAPLDIPIYLLPGNHDERGPLTATFADHTYLPRDGGPLCWVIDDHPVRIVGLDTTEVERHDGVLDDARIEWLDGTLGARPEAPTMIAMHHPPFDTGVWWMDCVGLRDRERFQETVRRHPQVRRVISGHVHRAVQTTWGETLVSVAPSTAHQVGLDLLVGEQASLTSEPPMLTLIDWRDDVIVNHTASFLPPQHVIDIPSVTPDWATARDFLLARGPMPKTGSPMG